MAKILIEQFHLSFYVPHGLSEKESNAIQGAFDASSFQMALRRAVRTVLENHRPLVKVSFDLTR